MDEQPIPGSAKITLELLREKHPDPKAPPSDGLLGYEPLYVNPILFERLTPALIRTVGRGAKSDAGLSGLDADARRHAYLF